MIRRISFTYWILKATHKHSEYVILFAFSLQQWLHEHAWILRYTYIDCLVPSIVVQSGCVTFPANTIVPRAFPQD